MKPDFAKPTGHEKPHPPLPPRLRARPRCALEKHGLAENTIVIFTADNGCTPKAKFPELHAADHHPSHTFRGHKADLYEGGVRVPFHVRWPAKTKAGGVSDRLVGQLDFLATFAEIAGAKIPEGAGEDSVSFLPALLGEDGGSVKPIKTAPARKRK